ncbi:hypothetical protein RYX36_020771 [Vicia faba]
MVDCDNGDKYDCELHIARRVNCVEKYIWQGWNDYTKKKGLKEGDILSFTIRLPPGTRILVIVLNW